PTRGSTQQCRRSLPLSLTYPAPTLVYTLSLHDALPIFFLLPYGIIPSRSILILEPLLWLFFIFLDLSCNFLERQKSFLILITLILLPFFQDFQAPNH